MFSPIHTGSRLPHRPPQSISDDENDEEPSQPGSSLIRRLMFTTQNCMTPGRALKRPKSRSESVKVYLRIRPNDNQNLVVKDQESLCMKHPQTGATSTYKFSRVFDSNTSQSTLFFETTAPLVDSLFHGYNALIFAYGITNSGKTYSILGNQSDPGIIPRTTKYLFNTLAKSNQPIDVYASYLEVHNDILIDLLPDDETSKPLSLIANKTGHVFVKGLREVKIESEADAQLVIDEGTRHRKCAQTALNTSSSRSHALFSLKLVRAGTNKDTDGIISKLCIVDLAGAERTSRAKNVDERRCREANNINKSLMQLGRCLEAVRWNQQHPDSKARPVPWRDSKISRLFKDYLVGGWGRAVMIATVNPDPVDHDETCHALKFAALASEVESVSKVDHGQSQSQSDEGVELSEDGPDREEELLEEIYHLKLQLLDCERRKCAIETETRNALCNELQQQAQRREAEFREQLEETEERARARAEKRFEMWKRRMISESGSGIDIEGAIQVAKQKAEEDLGRELAKLRGQFETNQTALTDLHLRYDELQNQLAAIRSERDAALQSQTSQQNELESVRSHVEELMDKLDLALQDIADRNAALEEQKRSNAASKQTISSLKQQKADLEAAFREAERKAAEAEKKEVGLKKRSEVNVSKVNALQKTITSLTVKVDKLEQELSEKSATNSDVTAMKDELESMTSELRSQLDAARSNESRLLDDINKLQDEKQMQSQKQAELERTISHLAGLSASQGEMTSRLGKENDELRQKIVILESAILKETDEFRVALQKLQDSSHNSTTELETVQKERDRLTNQLAELQMEQECINHHHVQLIEQMTLQRTNLDKEIAALTGLKAENVELTRQIEQLESSLKSNQDQLSRLSELEASCSEMESSCAELMILQEENRSLKQEVASLQKLKARELKDLQKRISSLESSAKKQEGKFEKEKLNLQKQLSLRESDNEKAEADIAKLRSELDIASESIKNLHSEQSSLKNHVQELEALRIDLSEKEKLVDDLKQNISSQQAELEQSREESAKRCQDMSASEASLRSQLSEISSKLQSHLLKEEALCSQIEAITAEKTKLETEFAAISVQNMDLLRKIDELHSQGEAMQSHAAENKSLSKEVKQLQKKIASLESQLEKKPRVTKEKAALQDRVSQLEIEAAKLADAQEEIQQLQQQITELKSKEESLKHLSAENASLRQRIQEFESAAERRQRIELEKQALQKRLQKRIAMLESAESPDVPLPPLPPPADAESVPDHFPADDASLSAPPSIVKKPVFTDKSNRPRETVKTTRIISAADQENAVPKTFGKRSRAVLEENLKWSSILTSDPFDAIAQKETSAEPKRKSTRKPVKEKGSPVATRRSTRSGR